MLKNEKIHDLPVVILAGGFALEFQKIKVVYQKVLLKLKHPIIYHIIKYFKAYGLKKFIICTGYNKNILKIILIKIKNLRILKF